MMMRDSERNQIDQACSESANDHSMLFHYTAFEALQNIIHDKRMRLSNLALLNDPVDYARLSNDPFIQNRVYVSCFTDIKEESIPLWRIYADSPYGVRIGF